MQNKSIFLSIFLLLQWSVLFAQDIPEPTSYSRIYEFIDELANDGYFELNSAIKPYSRVFIKDRLLDAKSQLYKLTERQKAELDFFLNEFALEQNALPQSSVNLLKNNHCSIALIQPALNYKDSLVRIRISPIIGMTVSQNSNGVVTKRWYGADFQAIMGKNLSVFGSIRDMSMAGPVVVQNNVKYFMGRLSGPTFLNDFPGYEYKEASYGGDYSDSRGGIKYGWDWGSVGLIKDNPEWGDNYHGSNILSGRTPSFPMLTLHLNPCKWFEMSYLHGWLVSNVIDSTKYVLDISDNKNYKMTNKFLAANMFTFTPVRNFKISIGNSIIYSEANVQAGYLMPIAFYKSIDHTMTKGLGLENQNSQVFMNISSRNIKHLHLYASMYADEIMLSRFSPSSAEKNPISYKIGAALSNFPFKNISIISEYTCNSIITYKHSIPTLAFSSNSYNLGSYLGDNSDEIYFALRYKPIRGLDLKLSYFSIRHGNEYEYLRRNDQHVNTIKKIISQPLLGEITFTNQTFGFDARYEVFSNAYAIVNFSYSDIRGYNLSSTPIDGEVRMTAQGYLDYFAPKYLQGKQSTITAGFSIGF